MIRLLGGPFLAPKGLRLVAVSEAAKVLPCDRREASQECGMIDLARSC